MRGSAQVKAIAVSTGSARRTDRWFGSWAYDDGWQNRFVNEVTAENCSGN